MMLGALNDHAIAVLSAESEQLERDCAQALLLTPPERWAHLQIVYIDSGIGELSLDWQSRTNEVVLTTHRIPPAVACSLEPIA